LFYDPMHITPETSKFVVLVEGEFDALSCLRENLPTKGYFGSGLSEEQIEQLSAYEQVFMAGDMDRAGMAGMMRTKERAAGRLKLKFVAYGAKDPGALTPGFGPAFFNDLRDDFEVPPLPNTQTLLDLI
jgi:DNA primase